MKARGRREREQKRGSEAGVIYDARGKSLFLDCLFWQSCNSVHNPWIVAQSMDPPFVQDIIIYIYIIYIYTCTVHVRVSLYVGVVKHRYAHAYTLSLLDANNLKTHTRGLCSLLHLNLYYTDRRAYSYTQSRLPV